MTAATQIGLHRSNSKIGRFNAGFFDTFDGFINWSLRRMKTEVYQEIPETIVEIGPGVGGNFGFYPQGTNVIAIEPNLEMHRRLEENARKARIHLELEDTLAEDTGLPSDSAQVVVSNLVLCTVADPAQAIAEAYRVLAPGGRLLIVEHVRGRGPLLRALQRMLRKPWKWLFEGCDLERDTAHLVRSAGFSDVAIAEKTHPTLFVPINSFAYGTATK